MESTSILFVDEDEELQSSTSLVFAATCLGPRASPPPLSQPPSPNLHLTTLFADRATLAALCPLGRIITIQDAIHDCEMRA